MEHSLKILGGTFTLLTLRYFVLAGIPFLIFYLVFTPYFAKSKIQSRNAIKKDFIREILHSLQSTAVFALISYVVLRTPFKSYTLVYDHLVDYPFWWVMASLVLSLVIHDTYFYWLHRLLHHKQLFRLTHLLHHRSTNPSPWTSYSFSFLESFAEGAVLLVIACLIPMHVLTIVLFAVVGFVINVYGHLGYEIAPRWFRHSFLFEILNTSVHHNMHHSKFKGNYGLYFRLWDRLLKTEHPDYVDEYDQIQAKRFDTTKNASAAVPSSIYQ
ncbi:MAG: sterol desaturase family protein [Pedobacter sp.]|nr:MAG: sterol desaturase family protein [Pedobacter sp.]